VTDTAGLDRPADDPRAFSLAAVDLRRIAAGGPVLPLVLVGVFTVLFGLDSAAFQLLFPEIGRSLGIGLGVMTAIATVPPLLLGALAPLVGFLADRCRRVPLQAVSAVLVHLAVAVGGMAPSAAWFLGSRLLFSGGSAVMTPTTASLYADYYPPQTRGRVFSFLGLAGAIGATLAPIPAGAAAGRLGWRLTLAVLGLAGALATLAFFVLKEPVRGMRDRLAAGADQDTAVREQRPLGWWAGWRAVWGIRTIRRFAVCLPIVTGVLQVATYLTVVRYADGFHLSPAVRGLVATAGYCPALLGFFLGGTLIDRLLARRPGRVMWVLAAGLAFDGAMLVTMATAPSLPLVVVANGLLSLCVAMVLPAFTTTMTLVLPARVRGLGLQSIAPFMLAALVISLAVSAVAQRAGAGVGLIACAPLLLAVGAVLATAAGALPRDIRAAAAANLEVDP
jgi:MFS family permease